MHREKHSAPTTVGIIGYGNFGAFVHVLLQRFAPHLSVRVYSPDKKRDGKLFAALSEVVQSDIVVFAVPISAYEAVLKKVVPLTRPDTILVDVATVKIHTVSLLKRCAGKRPYIAIHSMFGPESYAKRSGDVTGFRIVVTKHTLSKDVYEALRGWVASLGFTVIEMSPSQHDKHLAETLFLAHFIAQVVTQARFDRTDIDTLSFGFLMDAVESVRADKKLFKDVFKYNPYCEKVLGKLRHAEGFVEKSLKNHH